jgi:hypothetical protein
MLKKEFQKVADRQWVPVMISGDGRPDWMKNIPEDKVKFILASGTFVDPRVLETNGVSFCGVVGGMDVFRYDDNDVPKGFPYNKDHYIIILDPSSDDALLVNGPFKDHEHWINQLPNLPEGIEVIEQDEVE